MTTSESGEIAGAVENARRESEQWATADPTYAELMGTYSELGSLLMSEEHDEWLEDDCHVLVGRLIALGKRMDSDVAQELAARSARLNAVREAA